MEEALDLSFDRLLMMMITIHYVSTRTQRIFFKKKKICHGNEKGFKAEKHSAPSYERVLVVLCRLSRQRTTKTSHRTYTNKNHNFTFTLPPPSLQNETTNVVINITVVSS